VNISKYRVLKLAMASFVGLGSASLQAQTVSNPVPDAGKLIASTSSITTDNVLAAAPSTFSFSDAMAGASSPGGYLYVDYLIDVTSATAESVTTSLTNAGGVANLSERIYSYGGSFLGDAVPPSGALQVWSTNYPLPGASVSIIDPTNLASGQYVVELRGKSAGTFGGTLSLSPVPDADGLTLTLVGLGALGFVAGRRRRVGVRPLAIQA